MKLHKIPLLTYLESPSQNLLLSWQWWFASHYWLSSWHWLPTSRKWRSTSWCYSYISTFRSLPPGTCNSLQSTVRLSTGTGSPIPTDGVPLSGPRRFTSSKLNTPWHWTSISMHLLHLYLWHRWSITVNVSVHEKNEGWKRSEEVINKTRIFTFLKSQCHSLTSIYSFCGNLALVVTSVKFACPPFDTGSSHQFSPPFYHLYKEKKRDSSHFNTLVY